jgi:hypothetical protein
MIFGILKDYWETGVGFAKKIAWFPKQTSITGYKQLVSPSTCEL